MTAGNESRVVVTHLIFHYYYFSWNVRMNDRMCLRVEKYDTENCVEYFELKHFLQLNKLKPHSWDNVFYFKKKHLSWKFNKLNYFETVIPRLSLIQSYTKIPSCVQNLKSRAMHSCIVICCLDRVGNLIAVRELYSVNVQRIRIFNYKIPHEIYCSYLQLNNSLPKKCKEHSNFYFYLMMKKILHHKTRKNITARSPKKLYEISILPRPLCFVILWDI